MKISEYDVAVSVAGSDVVLGNVAGVTKQIPVNLLTGSGANARTFTYSSVGDTNGVVFFKGTANGATPFTFTNPDGIATVCTRSGNVTNLASALTSRTGSDGYAPDAVGSFAALDFGFGYKIIPNHYTLQNRTNVSPVAYPENWKLQGCNDATSNSVSDLNAATWTDIDTQTSNTAMNGSAEWFNGAVTGTTGYRWLRILTNGFDSTGSSHFLTIAQFEFYGTLLIG